MKTLDLRNISCPQNSSKALVFLSTIDSEEYVELLIDDGEPIQNVPSSLEIEGHKIIKKIQTAEMYWLVTVFTA